LKTTKIIALLIIIAQIGSLAAFGLSIYTIYGILSSTFTGGLEFKMDIDESTGASSLQVQLEPQNPSYIEADVSLGMSLLDGTGTPVSSGSTSMILAPGSSENITLILEVSREDFERISLEGKSSLEFFVSLRTLYNLIGISDTIAIPQGGQR
jgi:hypothetical protein